MQCWINGPFIGGIDDKIKMAIILYLYEPRFPRIGETD